MKPTLDVGRYLERIGYGGATRPTHETLAALVAAHTARVPFENLDVLLGRTIRLDLEGLQDKLVAHKRGGYCFEQATLMGAALDALGFDVARHAARVITLVPRSESPRTHMVLVVTLPEGRFVVDPGFGKLAPRVPVPLAEGIDVRFGDDAHRFAREGDHWTLVARVDGEDAPCWTTPLDETHPVDYEMANHFTSTHPSSPFRARLMLRAYSGDARVTVLNRDVSIRRAGGSTTATLADRAALRRLLADHFGFDLPEVEALQVPSVDGWCEAVDRAARE
jgi:N-hydroxyarylamine O-acetyltransferase